MMNVRRTGSVGAQQAPLPASRSFGTLRGRSIVGPRRLLPMPGASMIERP